MNTEKETLSSQGSSKRVLKQLFYLVFISIGSKILGFVREFAVANKLGTSIQSDAYFLAITVSVTICGGIIAAFSTSFIPVYSKVFRRSEDESKRFVNKLQTLIFLLQAIIIIVFLLVKPYLFNIFFHHSNPDMVLLANRLSGIMIFYLFASGVRTVSGGYLQYNNKTAIVYFVLNVVQNIIIILSIFAYKDNLDTLAYGYLIAGIIVAICLVAIAYRNGFRYKPDFRLDSAYVKEAIALTLPIFINQILMDINTFFDKSIASGLGTGIVSSLNYAYKINDIFVVTFGTTLATALYPEISKLIASKQQTESSLLLRKSLRQITMLLFPFSVMMLFYSNEIVEILLMRGAFTKQSAMITAQCLQCYCLGMLFFAYRQIFYRVMLSCHRTKKIMINSCLVVVLNISMNLILSRLIGYRGVAIATTVSVMIMTSIMLVDISKSEIQISYRMLIKDNAIYVISSVIPFAVVFLAVRLLEPVFGSFISHNVISIICIILSVALYVVVLIVKRDDNLLEVYSMISNKVRQFRKS